MLFVGVILGLVLKSKELNSMSKKSPVSKKVSKKYCKKYVNYEHGDIYEHIGCGSILWVTLLIWNFILGIAFPRFQGIDAEEHKMNVVERVGQRARDMFYPISNGWHVKFMHNYEGSNFYFKYQYDDSTKGKFNPRAAWAMNMALLLVAAYYAVRVKAKQKRKDRIQEDTVNMMLKIPFVGCDVNEKTLQTMMAVAPDIVSHMSKDRRIYFDNLIDGGIDMCQNPSNVDLAVEIMKGHLESNPSDLDAVLSFCREHAIPKHKVLGDQNSIEL